MRDSDNTVEIGEIAVKMPANREVTGFPMLNGADGREQGRPTASVDRETPSERKKSFIPPLVT